MLFTLGHGQHVVLDTAVEAGLEVATSTDAVPLDAVVEAGPRTAAEAAPACGKFAYYFMNAELLPSDPSIPTKLDTIADAMIEDGSGAEAQNSLIPPIFTYLGQFIDHDITANTDRDSALSQIDGAINPVPQSQVENGLLNLRDGSLRLDSLYGDTIGQGDFSKKLAKLMRLPANPAKMRLAIPSPSPQNPPLPAGNDDAADLLRLGFLIARGDIKPAELSALPADLKATFVNADGTPFVERAIIGDARNDENLLVAQFHMSLLRFHNKLVDAVGDFEQARKLMRWHYQWLVVNEYLPTVCDKYIVADVVEREAPLYRDFFAEHGTPGDARMPMPLEFSIAAYRYGHSMIRAVYDYNRFFGEAVEGFDNLILNAPFDLLFAFTGNGKMRGQAAKLPHNWVIEWERFVAIDPTRPHRSARTIDTHLAPPLKDMANEARQGASMETNTLFKHLARRNLRRGYRLSVPTAQACLAALAAGPYPNVELLEDEQLTSGAAGAALAVAGLAGATPLWFYILKEAEELAGGEHLGPLGSILVADTLVGLVVKDPQSYWHGSENGGLWSPHEANLPGGPIETIADLLRFAGML